MHSSRFASRRQEGEQLDISRRESIHKTLWRWLMQFCTPVALGALVEPLTFGFAEKVCCIAVSAWLGWRKGAGKPALLFVEPPPRRRHVLAAETKDAEYVRRKEVYLQESVFASYTQKMTQESQSRVSHLCMHFNEILLKAIGLKHAFIPESAWPRLW